MGQLKTKAFGTWVVRLTELTNQPITHFCGCLNLYRHKSSSVFVLHGSEVTKSEKMQLL